MAYLISKRVVAFFFVVLITTGVSQTPRSGNAGSGKAVNPVNFSIKGLRLHMTADEARPIMEQLAAENHSTLNDWGRPCASEKISALREHRELRPDDGRGACVNSMHFDRGDQFNLSLEFTEDLPRSPGTMRVWGIFWSATDVRTEADVKLFLSTIIEKYGPPTVAKPKEVIYCSETGPGKTCRLDAYAHYHDYKTNRDDRFYNRETNAVQLNCEQADPDSACQFPPQLGRVGFYASYFAGSAGIALYDATFRSQSAQEETKVIGETRTARKPVL